MATLTPRAFLQERLAFFGRVGFLFSISFLAVFNLADMLGANHPSAGQMLTNRSNQFHLGLSLVLLAIWLGCRTTERSPRALAVIESGGVWLAALACILPVWWSDLDRVHAMFLEVTQILVARAVIVPSTAKRTAWLGAGVVLPVTLMAWGFHQRSSAGFLEILKPTLKATLFCSMAVVLATLTSRVIYGLRQEVRKARQLGQYTLQEKLGEGGMGIVFRAQHAMLRRPTAVKFLPPDRAGESSIRRFEREVQITSRLTHPNTVSVYDYGRTPDGIFYYAMEFLDGVNLAQLVAEDGPQPPARVVHILRQVCGALTEAHGVGLIHRDIKPANVILCERWGAADVVKVVDFGLVKDLGGSDSSSSIENMVGTPQYISPEAVHTPEKVGPAADLYAVGAVGYFLITGRPLFESATLVDMLSQHLDRQPVPPSARLGRAVPPKLESVILQCLQKDPARRPARADVLGAALEAALDDTGPWTPEDAHSWWDRWRARPRSPAGTIATPVNLTDAPTLLPGDEFPAVIRSAS
jgi:eukaryotic-like serine/threonine-protein kinase